MRAIAKSGGLNAMISILNNMVDDLSVAKQSLLLIETAALLPENIEKLSEDAGTHTHTHTQQQQTCTLHANHHLTPRLCVCVCVMCTQQWTQSWVQWTCMQLMPNCSRLVHVHWR